jgi:hypothetical protein
MQGTRLSEQVIDTGFLDLGESFPSAPLFLRLAVVLGLLQIGFPLIRQACAEDALSRTACSANTMIADATSKTPLKRRAGLVLP